MNEILNVSLNLLYKKYPEIKKTFEELSVPVISEKMTFEELLSSLSPQWYTDSGLSKESLSLIVQNIITEESKIKKEQFPPFHSLTIKPGFDKDGKEEKYELTFFPGDIYAITGFTGSGKTRFLEDVEYIAFGDSPSKRQILINGKIPSEEERNYLENHLCASLSQSMNFVMELSCKDFIKLHTQCRKKNLSEKELKELTKKVLKCANSLAGEKFNEESILTQLSGGQARSLMIADIALISDAKIVLIDEPENAGIDKDEILALLSSKGKIVLVSTHDPVIALSCPKRIVIKNGAISSILEKTEKENELLETLKDFDQKLKNIRNCIRKGNHVC